MSDELARAHATLHRGAGFFGTWLRWPDAPVRSGTPVSHHHRSKVIGNGLRELDRFLNILIDEVSRRHGLPASPRQRNTARKLRLLREALGLPHEDDERLLALGRSRDCLYHCGGAARRGDMREPGTMTLGWPEGAGEAGPLRRIPVGGAISLERADLESVGLFYRRMADDLVLRAPGDAVG